MKRTVIITGGTKGLGRELSLAFGRAGYCVLALYSSDEQAAKKLASDLAESNATGFALRHDVCIEDVSVWNRSEIQEAESLILIHNACAPFAPTPMHQLSWGDFENNFLVAIKGAWVCSQPLILLLINKISGIVINVLSATLEGIPPKGFAAYGVAKHALNGFTLSLASEYSPRGLKIFSVSPGYMETSLTEQWDERFRERIRANASRITVPSEAAKRIVELVQSPEVPGQGETYRL